MIWPVFSDHIVETFILKHRLWHVKEFEVQVACKLSYSPDKWVGSRKFLDFGHSKSQTKPISVGNFIFNIDDFFFEQNFAPFPYHHNIPPVSCALTYGCQGNPFTSGNFAKKCRYTINFIHILLWLSIVTIQQVLFIDYVLSWIENMTIIVVIIKWLSSPFKNFRPPHTGFIFLWSRFLEPKKMTLPPICPPTPTRVFINTPQSRGETSLLWLGRIEPSYPPPRGKPLAFEKTKQNKTKQAANLQVHCTCFSEFSSTQISYQKLAYIIISSTFESEVLTPPWPPGGHPTFLGL